MNGTDARPPPLTAEQARIVRETYYALQPEIVDVTRTFYRHLFAAIPEARDLFGDVDEQQFKLAAMLTLVVSSLDRLEQVEPIVESLGHRHHGYGVQPQHFKPFGECLLKTLAQHTPQWSETRQAAWQAAWEHMSAVMQRGIARTG